LAVTEIASIMKKTNSLKDYILLYSGLLIYSLCSVMSKFASNYTVGSVQFCLFYSVSLMNLAIYALFWQQILKRFLLTKAYANRPMATVFGMLWGSLLFHEEITTNMLIGTGIIMLGIWMVSGNE